MGTKLTDIKATVKEVQAIITNIEGTLTSADTAIQEILAPIKKYWEDYEKTADEDLAKIEAEKVKCEAAPTGVSESADDATTAGETTPAETTLKDTTPAGGTTGTTTAAGATGTTTAGETTGTTASAGATDTTSGGATGTTTAGGSTGTT